MTRDASRASNELRVPRRATQDHSDATRETRVLEKWRAVDAYVLLADPGAGKSTAFEVEAAAEGTTTVSARDFIDGVAIPRGNTYFIDGLDEVRAGSHDRRTPLNNIRQQLVARGTQRFRISCREADWLGDNDYEALRRAAPNNELVVLHLEPLSDEDVQDILEAHGMDTRARSEFMRRANRIS